MQITAHSPCRVDLAGGTLDIWPLYLFHENSVTVNFAVDRRTRCTLRTRADQRIVLQSIDQRQEETFEDLNALCSAPSYKLPLLALLVRFFRPQTGIELISKSEAPAGAGISGSSSLIITVASAFNRLLNCGYTIEQIRELAQNVEAQIIRVPTGCQDYYPAMYGGVSAVELTPAGIRHRAIAVDLEDFNRRIVLAYTGVPRNSGINNWEVTKAHIDGDTAVRKNFEQIAAVSHAMRAALEQADWAEVGRLVREEWSNRRTNAPGISTPLIDRLIEMTAGLGARGAKVCGAGGGGCVFFLVEPDAKENVSRALTEAGVEVLGVEVARDGVQVQEATAE